MASYVIATICVTDPEAYVDYTKASSEAAAKYGARFLVRGGNMAMLEGSVEANRVVILEFETREKALAWWNSPEYEAAKQLRRRASTAEFILVDGA
jgi:uncharacterized protein (DUF1330 family)